MAKVVLVTGANKGIGFEVSRALGKAGFIVLLGARDAARGEEAAAKLRAETLDVRFVHADLERAHETATALAEKISQEFGDAIKHIFNTNFFGTVEFTQPLLPLLKAAPAARIVNVSSGLGSLEINTNPDSPFYGVKPLGYNASKAALNMFTVNLAWELRDTKAKVNSVCPGYVATDLNNHSGPGTAADGAIAIVKYAQIGEEGPTAGFFHKDGAYGW
jgi:NAD(P)-dependent dehydrogenase (short-subunit alcohol dehydrogenase family)